MGTDAAVKAQLHIRIAVIRPNALLWPQKGEDFTPSYFVVVFPYPLRLDPLAERTGEGNLVLTDTGRYFRIRPEEAGLYEHCCATKWGYTTQEAVARGNQAVRQATTGRGFPRWGSIPCSSSLLRDFHTAEGCSISLNTAIGAFGLDNAGHHIWRCAEAFERLDGVVVQSRWMG
ncbi:hypothetical protein GN244_ATG18379 [Phytophthora infestans]|uniref:Uncharacterized protein n=1 Tax=Phytophthora infestans TaxID=4787 RepID=A0A833VUY0_PHYIN|nr:hypothetical protein GN244_ATG18379 [Phytophthora infestans]